VTSKRALVLSDSPIARDPRVLKQVSWLSSEGFLVDTLGRGPAPAEVNGRHFVMPRPSVAKRVFSYLFLPNRAKYRALIESTIPRELASISTPAYEVVVANEVELLPWFVARREALLKVGGHAHLDLHEYTPSQRSGLSYRLVFKRWRDYLISFIPSSAFDSRSVVANGIADLFVERFGFEKPQIVRNCPDFVDLPVGDVNADHIRLVHHGVASLSRGLELMIDAMAHVDERFTLDLMLVGSGPNLDSLKKRAALLGSRVSFPDPVDVRQIPRAINAYDAEVIFFPPLTQNLKYALPNKFFEAVQGRLAIVTGQSSEMVSVVQQYGNGLVVEGWGSADLAAAINRLTTEGIAAMKTASDRAARDLSSASEKQVFLAALGLGSA
jgi:glycosyltransferase involved in cell wall biosynthesis